VRAARIVESIGVALAVTGLVWTWITDAERSAPKGLPLVNIGTFVIVIASLAGFLTRSK
jgi:hypothetical protein